MDQLVISILDDPSVSRVMREAGFSSSQVKSNVERVVSSETSSQSPPSPEPLTASINPRFVNLTNMQSVSKTPPCLSSSNQNVSKQVHSNLLYRARDEDVMHVIQNLTEKRRRSIVVVGENESIIEGVVRALADKLRSGSLPDDIAGAFKGVQLTDLQLPSFEHLSSEEAELKIGEVVSRLRSNRIHTGNGGSNGAILFLGDLRWVVENRANTKIGHLVAELGRLIQGLREDKGIWVMGIATLQIYMRCKSGCPSLESLWCLQPVTVPVGSLSFSLIADSNNVDSSCSSLIKNFEGGKLSSSNSWLRPIRVGSRQPHEDLSCCDDICSREMERETRQSSRSSSVNDNLNPPPSRLPPWLQQYKEEKKRSVTFRDEHRECYAEELQTRWNSICSSIHRQSQSSEAAFEFSSSSSSPYSPPGFPCEPQNPLMNMANRTSAEYSAWNAMEMERFERIKELAGNEMRILIQRLEDKVPWQKHIIPEIVTTILRCRSGMTKRKRNVKQLDNGVKYDTWFLFLGHDRDSKQKMAREIARFVYGSYESLATISISVGFEGFAEAANDDPRRVFLIEDVAEADRSARELFKEAIERGKLVKSSTGEEVDLKDAIIILCSSSLTTSSTAFSPTHQIHEDEEKRINPSLSLDLSISTPDGGSGAVGDRHPCQDSVEFTDNVDKLIHFEIHEL
ncbi:hypothetical protein SAY87_024100 [Trapa incisa]|uniref:Clp R domain-containing protein n=1 Tax=Trapa incisa TaxID=236973 RepID=A0AAN7L1Q6_9MYRT|nr:hypothetical protein SAY87_024100 [Trapa incisa]